jgi:coenzyme F420-0:L-glutamate ligase/coenzyme F420-1:gamma-L-glutamate ligase
MTAVAEAPETGPLLLPCYDPAMIIDDEVRAFVLGQRIGRLATADADGRPHVVPICFALDGDVLYSPIDQKPKRGDYARLRRLRNIAANPHVQVLFDVYDDDDWSRLRYVQLRGVARVIEAGSEHERAVSLLRARYRQYERMALESRSMIAVEIGSAVGWRPPQ